MAEKIRLRVWLAGLVPVALVVGGIAFLAASERRPARVHGSASPGDGTGDPPASTGEPAVAATPRAVTAQPVPSLPAPSVSIAAASPPATAPPSAEAIPELAELVPPPDSHGWSMREKSAYVRKALADLAARERTLEHERDAAHAAGDIQTERQKTATLEYLRKRRDYAERLLNTPGAMQGPVTGSPSGEPPSLPADAASQEKL